MNTKEEKNVDLIRLLKNDLEDLKYLYTFPHLYLYDYFSELKRRVDLAAAEKLLNDSDNLQLVDNYISIIDRISSFERDCIHHFKSNELINSDLKVSASHLIESIENELKNNQLNNMATVISYRDSLYEEAFKWKKALFQNQTIEFIQIKDSLVRNLFTKMDMNVTIGKLIIVKNQIFDNIFKRCKLI